MKKLFIFFTPILVALLFISCGKKPLTDDYGCYINYNDAVEMAGKKNQPLLVFFTSQGDDDASNQFVNGVLSDSSFKSEILSKYSVLHADFSQNMFSKSNATEGASAEQQEQANTYTNIMQNNYQLAVLFGVSMMPALFLCTKQGYVVCRLDESEDFGNLAQFKTALSSANEKLDWFNKQVALTNKGKALDKVEAVDAIYLATESSFRSFLLPLVQKAVQLDPNNETGLCGKFIFASAEAEAMTAFSQGDIETAIKKYLQAADNDFVKPEQKQECFYTAAYLVTYSGSTDYEGILEYMTTAYNLAPNSAKAPAIKEAISYFETVIEKQSEYDGE